MALSLIDKQDGFEIVRDQIAAIIKAEVINQMQLATDDGKDPNKWDLKVFIERSDPWEIWNETDDNGSEILPKIPIVSVWYDNEDVDDGSSSTVDCQTVEGIFNIDIYGYGESQATDDGHQPGDLACVLEAQRGIRLVRNILMAGENTYLQLRGFVGRRMPNRHQVFQPSQGDREQGHVCAARFTLKVRFPETAPQVEGVPLEGVFVTCKRSETGEIYFEADFDYTV